MSFGSSSHVCAPTSSLTLNTVYSLGNLPHVKWALHDCPLDVSNSKVAFTTVEVSNGILGSDDTDSFALSLCCDDGSGADCVDFYRFQGAGPDYYLSGSSPKVTFREGSAHSFCATPSAALVNCSEEDLRIRFAAGSSSTARDEIIGLQKVTLQCRMGALDGTSCLNPNAYISAPIGYTLVLNPVSTCTGVLGTGPCLCR